MGWGKGRDALRRETDQVWGSRGEMDDELGRWEGLAGVG